MRLFGPTGFGVFWWLIGLILISLLFTSSGGSGLVGAEADQWVSTTSYAFDSVAVSRGPDGTQWVVHWPNLLVVIAVTYLLSAVLASLLQPRLGLRRPVLTYASVIGGLVLVGMSTGAFIGKSYWGYWFERPGVLPRLNEFAKIEHVGYVKHKDDRSLGKDVTLVGPPDPTTGKLMERYPLFDESIDDCRKDEYYCLDGRLIVALKGKGLLPAFPSSPGDLDRLNKKIRDSGLLAEAEAGYPDSDLMMGVIADGRDKSGQRLVVLGLRGRQVSNDHYPYYEMAFSGPDLAFAGGHRFFFDVAGMEGAEWYGIGLACSLAALIFGLPIFTVAFLLRAPNKGG